MNPAPFIVFYTYLLKSKRKSLVNPAPHGGAGVNYQKGAG